MISERVGAIGRSAILDRVVEPLASQPSSDPYRSAPHEDVAQRGGSATSSICFSRKGRANNRCTTFISNAPRDHRTSRETVRTQ